MVLDLQSPLLHFSEDPSIERFVPHVPVTNPTQLPAVWAIDAEHTPVYWFPRDCPRTSVWANDDAEHAVLRTRFLSDAERINATELAWLEPIRACSSTCTSSTERRSSSGRKPKGSGPHGNPSSRFQCGRSATSSTSMRRPVSSCGSSRALRRSGPRSSPRACLLGRPTPVVRSPSRWQSGQMPDDSELAEINPYDLMESEAARLEFYFSSLRGDDWDEPSACEGWSVKDVLAHLAGGEEYNRACLTDSVGPMFESYAARGATDVNSFNALGVSDRKDKSPADLLDEFQRENGDTRADMRRRDGEDMPTAVGAVTRALAGVAPRVGAGDSRGRHRRADDAQARGGDPADWRARFARFALAEAKPDVEVQLLDDGTWVRANGVEATLTDDQLIDAVNARLPADSAVSPALREALAALG